jgi:predicted enzyme related to lactoylglutathione lyase
MSRLQIDVEVESVEEALNAIENVGGALVNGITDGHVPGGRFEIIGLDEDEDQI